MSGASVERFDSPHTPHHDLPTASCHTRMRPLFSSISTNVFDSGWLDGATRLLPQSGQADGGLKRIVPSVFLWCERPAWPMGGPRGASGRGRPHDSAIFLSNSLAFLSYRDGMPRRLLGVS